MKNTLETIMVPGGRLDHLERRSDRVRGRVRGAGHHRVGEALRDHERAEVAHVGHHVERLLDRHPLVGADRGVRLGEPLAPG